MSEPIPESIPTSSHRGPPPRKKLRHIPPSASAAALQANEIENLMYDPDRPVALPPTSAEAKASMAPPPEIVANVQGSSAGAGSGEFHVYKASRRREYERLRAMDEEAAKEEGDAKWEEERRRKKDEDEERLRKNRGKRNKRKKGKGKGGKESGREDSMDVEEGEGQSNVKKMVKVPLVRREGDEDGKDQEGSNGVVGSVGVAQAMRENGITIHDDD